MRFLSLQLGLHVRFWSCNKNRLCKRALRGTTSKSSTNQQKQVFTSSRQSVQSYFQNVCLVHHVNGITSAKRKSHLALEITEEHIRNTKSMCLKFQRCKTWMNVTDPQSLTKETSVPERHLLHQCSVSFRLGILDTQIVCCRDYTSSTWFYRDFLRQRSILR